MLPVPEHDPPRETASLTTADIRRITSYDDAYIPSISARVPDEDAEELESVAELIGDDKSTVVRRALREGLSDIRIQLAVERYQTGDVSVNQAVRIAGVSLAEWLQIARERNLTPQLSPDDLDADATTAREL